MLLKKQQLHNVLPAQQLLYQRKLVYRKDRIRIHYYLAFTSVITDSFLVALTELLR